MQLGRTLYSGLWKLLGGLNRRPRPRNIAYDILCGIRDGNPQSPLDVFGGSLAQAEDYARRTSRFLVIYIEGDVKSSMESDELCALAREVLGDARVAVALNEKFVFFAVR
jgi:hypothetical protein